MREVAVIGVGMNTWGELWTASLRQMLTDAALLALDDAGIAQVDSLVVGCMSSGLFVGQEHLGALAADYMGLGPIPAVRVESACASGGAAVRAGFLEVASGLSDFVLVAGVEKMTDCSTNEATIALATAADTEYEGYQGVTFPGLYAMMARAHMERFGTTREHLALVAVKNHANGLKNPRAQYQAPVTVEQVISSSPVAEPLNLLDCSPITDGAAAIILCPAEWARRNRAGRFAVITGVGAATDTLALHSRADLTALPAVSRAAERAFKMAGRGPADLALLEVHDCFTIAEILITEAVGLCEPGQGGPLVASGATGLGGRVPVNPSGGLKAKGHPVGATGVAQIVELTEQLRGSAGARQVSGARVAMAVNMGGSGASAVAHILEVA